MVSDDDGDDDSKYILSCRHTRVALAGILTNFICLRVQFITQISFIRSRRSKSPQWKLMMAHDTGSRQQQGPVSYLQSVSAGPARWWFAYPPATAHMFGKRNSWMWPRAKMGQTNTDGEKTPNGSLSDYSHPQKTVREYVCVHVCMCTCVQERDKFKS